jgi:manganese/zinc/iron transport system ATP- binding protein
MEMSLAVLLREGAFRYGRHLLWEGINLELPRGEFAGLMGPNGSGKSTLLKVLLGLLPLARGEMTVLGLEKVPRARIGYLPQGQPDRFSFSPLVKDVVLMGMYGGLGLLRFPGKKERLKAWAALDQVDMLAYKDEPLSHLSGGQQQRVFIARAIAGGKELLLLDEPTNRVDPTSRSLIIEALLRIREEGRTGAIIVSHDQAFLQQTTHRVLSLNGSLADGSLPPGG